MSKSKNKPQYNCILFYFEPCLATSVALDLLLSFAHAGFELICLFYQESEKWLPLEAIKSISHCYPVFWKEEKFTLPCLMNINVGIAVTKETPLWLQKSNIKETSLASIPWFFITINPLPFTIFSSNKLPIQIIDAITLSFKSIDWPIAFEKIFSRVVRYLRLSNSTNTLKKIAVQTTTTTANSFSSIEIETTIVAPDWLNELCKYLKLYGFTITDLEESNEADIYVDIRSYQALSKNILNCTYEKIIKNNKHKLVIQFFSPYVSELEIFNLKEEFQKKHNNKIYLPIIRLADGTLKLYTNDSVRIFPNLTAYSSLERLADYILYLSNNK